MNIADAKKIIALHLMHRSYTYVNRVSHEVALELTFILSHI